MLKLLRRIQFWIRHRQLETDLIAELEVHRAMTEERLRRGGLRPTDAVDGSRRALGNVTLAREDARHVWLTPWLETVQQDLRYALRGLRREPGFACLAVATLGVTIGLNTSVFTAFNAILLRPWPVRDAAQIVTIADASTRSGFSVAEYRYFVDRSRSFAGLICTRCIDGISEGCQLDLDGQPVKSHFVTGNYFDVLGVTMERGRTFQPADDRAGASEPVAIVSYAAWQARFGADPAIIGRRIRLDDVPFTVVGVADRSFPGTAVDRKDVWLPIAAIALLRPNNPTVRERFENPRGLSVALAGRLAPGVSRAEAQSELEILNRQFRAQFALEDHGVLLMNTTFFGNPFKRKGTVPLFAFLFLGVLLVLLLACANVGNLLLARAAARRREIVVRLSLGAARCRIVRQLLTESMTLAIGAALLGLALAFVLPKVILDNFMDPVSWHVQPDGSVLAFTIGLAALTCLAFGLAPALHAVATDVAAALKPTADRFDAAGMRLSLRGVLLALQVAISVVLLVCAALLVRSVWRGYSPQLGFRTDGVGVLMFDLPASYEPARQRAFTLALLGAGDPHADAGYTSLLPFGRLETGVNWRRFRLPEEQPSASKRLITPEVSNAYFEVLGIPLLQGRLFEAGDADAGAVLINESMARAHWPGEGAVGRTIIAESEHHIVGVVKDVIFTTSFVPEPTMYRPMKGSSIPQVVFRESGRASAESIAAAARLLEPRVRITTAPFSKALDGRFSGSRMAAAIGSALGALSVTLAAVGVFGVFRYLVQQRTREIGIRIALGAQPQQLVRFVLASGGYPLAVGVAVGLFGAFAASAILRGSLHGLSALDPAAYGGAAAALVVAALAAIYFPARRAIRVDPAVALRCE